MFPELSTRARGHARVHGQRAGGRGLRARTFRLGEGAARRSARSRRDRRRAGAGRAHPADEKPHVEYLRTALSELRARTLRSPDGSTSSPARPSSTDPRDAAAHDRDDAPARERDDVRAAIHRAIEDEPRATALRDASKVSTRAGCSRGATTSASSCCGLERGSGSSSSARAAQLAHRLDRAVRVAAREGPRPRGTARAAAIRRSATSRAIHQRNAEQIYRTATRAARAHDQDVSGDRHALRRVPARVRRTLAAVRTTACRRARSRRSAASSSGARQAPRRGVRRASTRRRSRRRRSRRCTARGSSTAREVAVKVQYPDIDGIVRTDLAALRRICRIYERFDPQPLELLPLLDELQTHLALELDFRREVENADRMRALFAEDKSVLVPEHRLRALERARDHDGARGRHQGDRPRGARGGRARPRRRGAGPDVAVNQHDHGARLLPGRPAPGQPAGAGGIARPALRDPRLRPRQAAAEGLRAGPVRADVLDDDAERVGDDPRVQGARLPHQDRRPESYRRIAREHDALGGARRRFEASSPRR